MRKFLFGFLISIFALSLAVTPALAEEESYTYVEFSGMLIEIGSTDVPTTLIVRENETDVDYTVNVTSNTILGQKRDQYTKLEDWIPGDQITIKGNKNDNTGVVDANAAANRSIVVNTDRGLNGWITEIQEENNLVKVQWAGVIYDITVDDSTHIVSGLKNPATISDLQVGDRVRGRVLKNVDNNTRKARIMIVLRRGEDLFMKVRTWVTKVELLSMSSSDAPATLQVQIMDNPWLREGDVNNLIGVEGDVISVNVTESTKFVRKYLGVTDLSEFVEGDELYIVGRSNDNGTVDAKLIKNNSIWSASTKGFPSVIQEINTSQNYIIVEWHNRNYRVDISDSTHIVRYNINPATIYDLQLGDAIKIRGTAHSTLDIVNASEMVVVQ